MKKVDWKILIITSIICLLPILYGVTVYDEMPDNIAIHFDINNEPDRYAPKAVTIFGLPVLMCVIQTIACVLNDVKTEEKAKGKVRVIFKAIIPTITIVMYFATISYALNEQTDIRKIACFLVGTVFVILGNYIPKTSKEAGIRINMFGVKNKDEAWLKIRRPMGYLYMIFGVAFIISTFLETIASVIVLITMIVAILGYIVYAYVVAKKLENKEENS